MSAQDDIIVQILDLDKKAEEVISNARKEAEKISAGSLVRIEEEKSSILKQIEKKKAEINDAEAGKRSAEIKKVRDEYLKSAQTAKQVDPGKIEKVVKNIITNIKGTSR